MSSANALKDVRDPPSRVDSTHAGPFTTTNYDASTHAARNFAAVCNSAKLLYRASAAALHGE